MSILSKRMLSGTWIQPNHRTTNHIVQLSEVGTGEIYTFQEEPLAFDKYAGFGYYPISLGASFAMNYCIVRKLGWSNGSTIWLGHNVSSWLSSLGAPNVLPNKFVAIKIKTVCESYRPSHEFDCYKSITAQPSSGLRHCLPLLAFREELSPELGRHSVFITPITGPDLTSLGNARRETFRLPVVKKIIKQILLALEHIHASGFLHDDLRPDNIVVSLPDDDSDKVIEELLESSPSETYPAFSIPLLSDESIVTVKTQPIPPIWLEEDLGNLSVKLIDYGQALPLDKTHLTSPFIQLDMYRAPEVTLGCPISQAMDIWSLGCTTLYLLTGVHIFEEPSQLSPAEIDRNRLFKTIELLGYFPRSFLASSSRRSELLDKNSIPLGALDPRVENGKVPVTLKTMPRSRLEDHLRGLLPNFTEEGEISDLCDFVRRCWTLDPRERPSTSELLRNPWLAV